MERRKVTTPPLDGYPAVLVRLEAITPEALAELVAEAWLAVAPKRLAAAWPLIGPAPEGEADRRGPTARSSTA